MCHFLPVYYLGIVFLGRVEGQNITTVLLFNSGQKVCSVKPTRWARTLNCSKSPNLEPNSNASELPPSTSRVNTREYQKQSPQLVPDTALFKPRKVTWPKKVAKGLTAFSDKQYFAPQVTSNFRIGFWLQARKGIACFSLQHWVRRQGSAQVSHLRANQCFSRSGIPRPPLHGSLLQISLRSQVSK